MFDDNFKKIDTVKTMPLDNKLLNIHLKTIWPLGARDILIQEGQVRFQDKHWIVNFSVEDEACPVADGTSRIEVPQSMIYIKPNPSIHGYTMYVHSEMSLGGAIPLSLILNFAIQGNMTTWTKMQKLFEKMHKEKQS